MTTPVTVSDERLEALSGQLLADRYQLGTRRAAGAFCVVYDGQDSVLRRPVAIKVTPREHALAYREALNATAGLSYPAFIATYDALEQDERFYLVQEHVDGRPLSAYLADGVPARRGVALALQLARAIAYAHQHELTHGDLTPAAILVDRNAVAHINNVHLPPDWDYYADIATAVSTSGMTALSAGELLTALRGDEHRRDVWSVGAALWALVTRADADGPQAVGAVLPAHAYRVYGDDVPDEVRELLSQTLDVAHVQRTPSAADLALTLEALDEALARGANRQRDTLPLAIRAYREVREPSAAGMATGLRRLIERQDDRNPDAPTYPWGTEAETHDSNQTRPADDALYAASMNMLHYRPRADEPFDRFAAPRGADARDARMSALVSDANPAWQIGVAGHGVSPIMRPWVWGLIGIVLFVAFFLIGYLVFPQFKLF